MDPLTALAVALGSAWGSGINLYATVLVLGGLDAFGIINLPDSMSMLSSTWVLAAAALLYFVEFFADKIPGLDSIWDMIHTFIRIPAGALMAAGAAGGLDFLPPEFQTIAGLIGGGAIAAGTHAAKSGARAVINTSPEPFTNWGMSLFEDVLVFGGMTLAVFNPMAFLIGLGVFVLLLIWLVPKIWRGIIRFFGGFKEPETLRRPHTAHAPAGASPNGSTAQRNTPASDDTPLIARHVDGKDGADGDADFFDDKDNDRR